MMAPGYYGMGPGPMGPGYYGMGPGMMGPGQQGWQMGPGMMGRGYYGMGPGMMAPGQQGWQMVTADGPTLRMEPGIGADITSRFSMGPGMMGPGNGMGPGMMGPGYGMNPGQQPWAAPRVSPRMNLTSPMTSGRTSRAGPRPQANKRLKVGEVEGLDDDAISSQIVTVDGSLVESYKVDRHWGAIVPAG